MKKIYLGMISGYGPLAQALPIVNILKEDKNIEIISNMFDGALWEVLGSLGFRLREQTKRKIPENSGSYRGSCIENLRYSFSKYFTIMFSP